MHAAEDHSKISSSARRQRRPVGLRRHVAKVPMGRARRPDEIAVAVLCCAVRARATPAKPSQWMGPTVPRSRDDLPTRTLAKSFLWTRCKGTPRVPDMIDDFLHISISCRDLKRTIRFYEALGLTTTKPWARLMTSGLLLLPAAERAA